MQRNTGYFPTESLEPSGNRLFSRSALNEGDLFRGSLSITPREKRFLFIRLTLMRLVGLAMPNTASFVGCFFIVVLQVKQLKQII